MSTVISQTDDLYDAIYAAWQADPSHPTTVQHNSIIYQVVKDNDEIRFSQMSLPTSFRDGAMNSHYGPGEFVQNNG